MGYQLDSAFIFDNETPKVFFLSAANDYKSNLIDLGTQSQNMRA